MQFLYRVRISWDFHVICSGFYYSSSSARRVYEAIFINRILKLTLVYIFILCLYFQSTSVVVLWFFCFMISVTVIIVTIISIIVIIIIIQLQKERIFISSHKKMVNEGISRVLVPLCARAPTLLGLALSF